MTERKCVGCGKITDRENLIKITKDSVSGNIVINGDTKIFGRSAYLCYNENCKELAFKKNRLNKALKSSKDLKGLLDGRIY